MDLATARAIRKRTQWDLRKLTGIHQSKLSLIKHGYIIPNEIEKCAIAKALDYTVDEINWLEPAKCQKYA